MEIKKVRMSGKSKVIVIPKKCEIKSGDYVKIIKILDDEIEGRNYNNES